MSAPDVISLEDYGGTTGETVRAERIAHGVRFSVEWVSEDELGRYIDDRLCNLSASQARELAEWILSVIS